MKENAMLQSLYKNEKDIAGEIWEHNQTIFFFFSNYFQGCNVGGL